MKMNMIFKGIITIFALSIVVIFGFLLSKNGKPYNDVLFTIHKVVALAMIIYSYLYIKQYTSIIRNDFWLVLFLIIIVICILALFVTGALLSIGKVDYVLLKRLHLPIALLMSVSAISFVVVFLKKIA
ncbi:hypothetical protein AN1V17_00790 [Vallitalea sediminicola]